MNPASARARLRNAATALGIDFQQALQYYALERFLFRLAQTPAADNLILKGAAMLRVWGGSIARPTRDLDFLGRVENSPAAVKTIVLSCLDVMCDDGLEFHRSIETAPIAINARYPGVRARIRGHLDGARFVVQIDIGIGDSTVPDPGYVDYPTMLGGEPPRILGYHPATTIAEKMEAMVTLGAANSRMKDFFDLWYLSTTLSFHGRDMAAALEATFARRRTRLPTETPLALTPAFTELTSTQAMWHAFLRKMARPVPSTPARFADAGVLVDRFVMPPAIEVASGRPFDLNWTPGRGWE